MRDHLRTQCEAGDVHGEDGYAGVVGGPDRLPDRLGVARAEHDRVHPADDEVVDLLWKPYMGTFKRDVVLESVRYYRTIFDWDLSIDEKAYERGMKVWVPLAVDNPIPFAKAVDMSFLKKAQAKIKS